MAGEEVLVAADRFPDADEAVAVADGRRHMSNLIAARLALFD